MRVWLDLPLPPEGSTAAVVETLDHVTSLLMSLVRRCELERCSVLLERDRDRFCSDEHRVEFNNRQRYRQDPPIDKN